MDDPSGHFQCATVAKIHLLMSAEYMGSLLLDAKELGKVCTYINDPSPVPNQICKFISSIHPVTKSMSTTSNYTKQKNQGNKWKYQEDSKLLSIYIKGQNSYDRVKFEQK